MTDSKTSTFVVVHDECRPDRWSAHDLIAFARFVATGDLTHAARMARKMGLRLVTSEHHEPVGGTLQPIGYVEVNEDGKAGDEIYESVDYEICPDEMAAIAPVYRGPTQWAVRIPTDDGAEIDVYDDEARANAIVDEIYGRGER